MSRLVLSADANYDTINASVLANSREGLLGLFTAWKTNNYRTRTVLFERSDSVVLAKQSVNRLIGAHPIAGPLATTDSNNALLHLRHGFAFDLGH